MFRFGSAGESGLESRQIADDSHRYETKSGANSKLIPKRKLLLEFDDDKK